MGGPCGLAAGVVNDGVYERCVDVRTGPVAIACEEWLPNA
jgi:hypothetical protein